MVKRRCFHCKILQKLYLEGILKIVEENVYLSNRLASLTLCLKAKCLQCKKKKTPRDCFQNKLKCYDNMPQADKK